MSAWREGYVAGGDTRFFVRVLGHGPDLALLLHGWPGTGRAWHRVAPILADAGYRVACPDLKGFGRSVQREDRSRSSTRSLEGRSRLLSRPGERRRRPARRLAGARRGYDSRTLADEITRLIRGLHVRKAVVVGHDWGGAVALATAFRHPGRVRALVLANSPYRELDLRRAWAIPLLNLPILPEVAFRLESERLVRLALRYAAVRTDVFPPDVVAEYADAVRADPGGWLAYYRTLSRRALVERGVGAATKALPGLARRNAAHRLRVPASVLWGAEDPVLPIALGRSAADELGARFVP
ncbi:MAG TPA: alpha/beta hydrolase, partial [Nitriliruptorales bacterium]|nr:alpha/beta hydrolase [Nitriliruptorales bacterium]